MSFLTPKRINLGPKCFAGARIPSVAPIHICFTCSKIKAPAEFTSTILAHQNISNSLEERNSILQVICQLLRVEWKSIQQLTLEHDSFPFCASCFTAIIEIVVWREKLFEIESDIRRSLSNVEEMVAKSWAEFGNPDVNKDAEGAAEPVNYRDFRTVFQQQIVEEFCNKQLMQQKILELSHTSESYPTELIPSMVQLQLDENVFQIGDQKSKIEISQDDESEFLESPIRSEMEMLSVEETEQFRLVPVSYTGTETAAATVSEENSTTGMEFLCATNQLNSPLIPSQTPVQYPTQEGRSCHHNSTFSIVKSDSLSSHAKKGKLRKIGVLRSVALVKKESSGNHAMPKQRQNPIVNPTSPRQAQEGDALETEDDRADDDSSPDYDPDIEDLDESGEPTRLSDEFGRKHIFQPKHSLSNQKKTPSRQRKSTPVVVVKLVQAEATVKAKDKSVWTTVAPSWTNGKTRAHNVLRETGGLLGPAANTKLTPADIFRLMLPPSIVEVIVKHTNSYAATLKHEKLFGDAWTPVTVEEIYAYIGIILLFGVEKKRNAPATEAWSKDERYCIQFVVATMSRDRFQTVQKCLRFDDKETRNCSTETDGTKRCYVSELLDPFVATMESHLRPYDTLVVDEMLVNFYGKAKFRVYMKTKPGKYGIKFWAVCDVETGYILKISLYEGKVGDARETQLGKKVVLDLVKKYFNSGRAVTMDNFFTSKALGEELVKQKLSMLGTLNTNRMDVIPQFTDPKGREIQSSIFAFQGDFAMSSYVKQKNRAILLLSTGHRGAEICPGTKNKPKMMLDYNASKGGVDTADHMIANFSCQRQTSRWPVKIFYSLLDIAALNAYIVHKKHGTLDPGKEVLNRRTFLRKLTEDLMQPLIATRVRSFKHLPGDNNLRRCLLSVGYEYKVTHTHSQDSKRSCRLIAQQSRLCIYCKNCDGAEKSTNTQTLCNECMSPICRQHQNTTVLCDACAGFDTQSKALKDL